MGVWCASSSAYRTSQQGLHLALEHMPPRELLAVDGLDLPQREWPQQHSRYEEGPFEVEVAQGPFVPWEPRRWSRYPASDHL